VGLVYQRSSNVPGHPFRGNQHVTQGEHGGVAVHSSMRAKHAELKGDKKAQKKAHKSAYHAHAAAAEDASSKKSRKYHKTMAKFHGSRAGLTLDAVEFEELEIAESPVLDAVETSLSIVGRIYVGGELKGRALIGGDGKAMVYKGAEGTERVSFTSPVDGAIRTAMWSDGDAPDMVGWLLNPPAALTSSPFDAFMDSGKQSWQVTRAEWVSLMVSEYSYLGTPANESNKDDFRQYHREHVKVALDAGKAVPAEVLADYPGMKAESAEDKDARVAEAEVRLKAALGIHGATVEDTTDYIAVAQTIGAQLGGSKFKAMTGAKDFMSLSPKGGDAPRGGLRFSLPANFAFSGINRVFIRLNDTDTYDLEFGKATFSKTKGSSYKVIETSEGVYAENLREVFTERTGLDVSLGTGGPQVKLALPKKTYEQAKADVDAADARMKLSNEKMNTYPTGNMGLTPDHIKATPEWQADYSESNKALAQVRAANEFMTKNYGDQYLADRRAAREAKLAASQAPNRVTMKEARDAYSMLEYSVDDLSGHQNAEFLRADVLGRLEPKMLMIKALVKRGWPEQVYSPEGLLKKAQGLIDRHEAMSASGLTEDMGQSEAWGYLTHDKKLPAERVDQILATPSRVEKSGGQLNADVPKYTMAYLNAEADKQESTTVEEQAPDIYAGNGSTTWLVTNTRGYRKEIKADSPIGATQIGMSEVDYTISSSDWTAVPVGGESAGVQVDPAKDADTAYIQTIIDGTADLLDPGLYDKLEPLFAKYEADPEMMALLNRAADAYGKAVEAAAMAALGK
jgi:hypothetical protein